MTDEFHIVKLKRFEKTELELELDKYFGWKERGVYSDIEKTYMNAIMEFGTNNVKIKTNLVRNQIYRFAAEEVEIIN